MSKDINKDKFVKFYARTWSDPKVLELDHFEERFFITSWSNCFSIKGVSGIYEVSRGCYESTFGFSDERIQMLSKYSIKIPIKERFLARKILDQIITNFNTKYTSMLEYDVPNHMISVKNYFKYQYKTIGNVAVAIRMLLNESDAFFEKSEKLWTDFGKKNRKELIEMAEKLDEYIKQNDLLLFDLNKDFKDKVERKEKPSAELVKKINNTKENLAEYIKLKPRFANLLKLLRVNF
jgi:hypothetical protein